MLGMALLSFLRIFSEDEKAAGRKYGCGMFTRRSTHVRHLISISEDTDGIVLTAICLLPSCLGSNIGHQQLSLLTGFKLTARSTMALLVNVKISQKRLH